MTLEGLSIVCAKLEPANSQNNETLKVNVLQNLHRMLFMLPVKISGNFPLEKSIVAKI